MGGLAERRLDIIGRVWGWEPHCTQREWLLAEAGTKVAACGRRWGKTEAEAYDAAAHALVCPGSVQMIVSPTYDQSKLIFNTVERLVFGHDRLRGMASMVKTPYPRMCFENGSVIMARTADEDGRNLRGHSADRVIVDEAAFVRDAVIEEVVSPMLADRNGQLVLISTPFGRNHFYRAYIRGEEGDPECASFRFPSWENPFISRDYIEKQRDALTPRQFSVEYEALFMDDVNSVFPWKDIRGAVELCGDEPKDRWQDVNGRSYLVAGVDLARYSDYTAVVVVDAWKSPFRVVRIERFNGISWNEQVTKISELVGEMGIRSLLMDQTSIGDPVLEQTRERIWKERRDVRIEGYTFTNQSKREVIDSLALALSHNEMAIPDDERLVRELQYYEYELTEAGNIRMNARRGHHDDLVVGLALGLKAAKMAPGACMRIMTSGRRLAAMVPW